MNATKCRYEGADGNEKGRRSTQTFNMTEWARTTVYTYVKPTTVYTYVKPTTVYNYCMSSCLPATTHQDVEHGSMYIYWLTANEVVPPASHLNT